MAEWLVPGGRLLLTVPYGRFEDHGWLINYDADHLGALIKSSELIVDEMSYFGWLPGGWREVGADEVVDFGYKSLGAAHAAGVALVELRKGRQTMNRAVVVTTAEAITVDAANALEATAMANWPDADVKILISSRVETPPVHWDTIGIEEIHGH